MTVVLVIEIEATEPTLGHLQEPIRKGHCIDLLLAVTVRAPAKGCPLAMIRRVGKDGYWVIIQNMVADMMEYPAKSADGGIFSWMDLTPAKSTNANATIT